MAIAVVQRKYRHDTRYISAANSTTFAFDTVPANGNLVLFLVAFRADRTLSTVDAALTAWAGTSPTNHTTGNTAVETAVYWDVGDGSLNAWDFEISFTGGISVVGIELSGVDTTTPYRDEAIASNGTTAGTSLASGNTGANPVSGDYALAFLATKTADITAQSFTNSYSETVDQYNAGDSLGVNVAELALTSGGATSTTASWTTSARNSIHVAVVKAAPTGPSVNVNITAA